MLYEMAASLINSIVEGPDYEPADVQEKIILQRGQDIQRELTEFEFERVFWVTVFRCGTEGGEWNWGVFEVELRGFLWWTEEFLVLNWRVFGVELKDFGAEKVWSLCGNDVLNWGVCAELRGTRFLIV